MNTLPTTGIWLQALGLLAAQCAVLLLAAGLAQGRARAPQTRRRLWLAALAALALLLANSLSGLDQSLARWFAAEPSSAPTFIVRANLPAPSTGSGAAISDLGTPGSEPAEAPQSSGAPVVPGGVAWPAWLWVAGAVVTGFWALVPRIWLACAGGRATRAESPEVQQRVLRLSNQLNIRKRVRVVSLPRLAAPIAFGVFRPSVGVPAGFWEAHSAAEQDAMLAHELAHLAVKDPLWLALADILAALLWWHPLVWWARRQFRAASETTADEASLLVDDGPAVLAGCLVELASRWQQRGVLGLLGMAGFRSDLGRRVERLLHLRGGGTLVVRRRWPDVVASAGAALVLVMVVVVSAWLFPAQAAARPTLLAVVGDALEQRTTKGAAFAVVDANLPRDTTTGSFGTAVSVDTTNSAVTVTVRVPPTSGVDASSARVVSMDAVTQRLAALQLFSETHCEPFDTDRFHVHLTLRPIRSQPSQSSHRVFPVEIVRQVITRSGQLQFRRVHPDTVNLIQSGECPADCEVLTQRLVGAAAGQRLVVFRQAEANLTSTNLRKVMVKRDAVYSEPRVEISFDDAGTKAFAELTRASIGQQIAVVLEGEVRMAPYVRQAIPVGKCELSGSQSEDEARALAAALVHPLAWKLAMEDEVTVAEAVDTQSEAGARASSAADGLDPSQILRVSIGKNGELKVGQLEQTLESLLAELRKRLSKAELPLLALSAHEKAPYSKVLEVVEACQAAGVMQFSFHTSDASPAAQGADSIASAAPSGAGLGSLAPIAAKPASGTTALVTRTFRIEARTLAAGLNSVAGTGPTNLTARQQLRRVFGAAGLEFPETSGLPGDEPSGRALFYNESNAMLLVRAAPAELAAVEQLLQVLNVTLPQVVIEAKFVEVSMDAGAPRGFDWYLGSTLVGSNAVAVNGAGMATEVFPTPPAGDSGGANGGGVTIGVRSNSQLRDGVTFAGAPGTNQMRELRGDQLVWPGRDATNAANIRVSAAQGVTVTGILTDPQFRTVIRALEQRSGVEVLSAPRVTTLSGRQAQIQVSEFRTVLTGVNPGAMKIHGATGATNGLPFTNASIPTGPSLDVIPVVSADGLTINLTVIPTVTEFLGYDAPPKNAKVEVIVNGKPRMVDPPLPRFRVRQMVTQAVVRDGQTLVLGGFPVEEVRMTKDKVPVLGDIPIAGRLFRHESRSTVRKQLMVLVTATIVDPAGNPVHAVNP